MVTALKNEPASPSRKESGGHRMDSSHLLRALLMFARSGSDEESGSVQSLGGVITTSVLRSLLSSLHHRDAATVRHSRRVAKLVVGMAHYLGWDGPQQKVLEVAALLHDIGKIGVPDNILFKPGKLNPDEADMMALHYRVGLDVLQACKVDQQVLDMIRYSYSYVDIASESCTAACLHSHQGSRILAVADAYDSLSTDQVYRPAKPHNEVMRVLQEASGTRFDGNVVSALSRWIDGNGLPAAGEQENATPAASASGTLNPEDAAEITTIGNIFSYLFVLESLYDGFYLVDGGMRFCIWNRGCEKIFGKSAADILGTLWSSEAVSYNNAKGKQLPDAANPTHRVITEAKPLTSTVFVKSPEGETIEVEVQSLPLFDAQARLQGVAEIIRGLGHTKHHPREYRELKLAASRDALTSVANRRELESKLAGLFLHYTKSSDVEPFSVIFLDIDFFKNINDTFGHTVGDDVLIDLAKLLQQEMYSGEIVGRYGGEEFVVLCPQTNLKQALSRAERLRSALPRAEQHRMGDYKVTASFGVAEVEPDDDMETLLKRADKALYMAKESGRNRTCSLTSEQLAAQQAAAVQGERSSDEKFTSTATFKACIAADMVVYKLGGFVSDHDAELLEVDPKKVEIRVGKRTLLGGWGRHKSKQPVHVVIQFGEQQVGANRGPMAASRQVEVQVTISAIGIPADEKVFQKRAIELLKNLRAHFAAD